jgi:hypothetical protein
MLSIDISLSIFYEILCYENNTSWNNTVIYAKKSSSEFSNFLSLSYLALDNGSISNQTYIRFDFLIEKSDIRVGFEVQSKQDVILRLFGSLIYPKRDP